MVFHPPGIVVANCGEVLEPHVVVRLLKMQLMVEGTICVKLEISIIGLLQDIDKGAIAVF